MTEHLLISVISDDKPGVVKAIASAVSSHGGNWLESRLAQLAGKFAGVIRIAINPEDKTALCNALAELSQQGIKAVVDTAEDKAVVSKGGKTADFTAVGPDRKGIVYEISQAFTQYNINVDELTTRYSSMPYSGEPLFEAYGTLSVPAGTDWDKLQDQLDEIADALAMDITLD
jgi:glycine cleavage system regulatory protein